MLHKIYLLLFLFLSLSVCSQPSSSPYETDLLKDGIWITAGVGLNVAGVLLIQEKPDLTEAELHSLSKDDVFFLDRGAVGNYSPAADDLSYIPFYGSFAMAPIVMLLNKNERQHAGQVSVLFVETMATTGALFTITAGLVKRSRPLVYSEDAPLEERLDGDSQRSFFAGHTAATAAATFFTAKVFSDFNPNSWAKPYVWTAAALVPAWVGYLRLKAGKHFITDNLIGYGIGALCGIMIPELHKKENQNLSLIPSFGSRYKGIILVYDF
ncbi:MAG TPA: phosphatase PAP2 family protein [Salinimicrobium sp.]|nr:phosphatase PAP2 family protein [Salinimicrobium sp.]